MASELLPRQPLDCLYGAGRAMPPEKLELFVFERVRSPEKLFQFLASPRRDAADVLQIGLKRRAVGHCEHTIVPLFRLPLGLLLDFENSHGPASKHYTGIGLSIVDDQNVEWVAVFRLSRRNEAPVIRISEAGHQRLGKRERTQRRIEIKLAGAAARGLDYGVDVLLLCPCRDLQQVSHVRPSRACRL